MLSRKFMGMQVIEISEKQFPGVTPDFGRTVAKPLQSRTIFVSEGQFPKTHFRATDTLIPSCRFPSSMAQCR
jgi:hypothetical protein